MVGGAVITSKGVSFSSPLIGVQVSCPCCGFPIPCVVGEGVLAREVRECAGMSAFVFLAPIACPLCFAETTVTTDELTFEMHTSVVGCKRWSSDQYLDT